MASLKMNIPHKLSQEEALSRIKGLLGKLKQEQKDKISDVKEEWHGETGNFQFTAQGFDLSGVIHVQPSSIDIDANVPFAVSLFQGKIKQLINEKARELLSK
jgi:Putative polyhydroxyalkanoic acid system protein (PHA_gran_rgn)